MHQAKDAGAAIRAAECQSQREVGFSEDFHTIFGGCKNYTPTCPYLIEQFIFLEWFMGVDGGFLSENFGGERNWPTPCSHSYAIIFLAADEVFNHRSHTMLGPDRHNMIIASNLQELHCRCP